MRKNVFRMFWTGKRGAKGLRRKQNRKVAVFWTFLEIHVLNHTDRGKQTFGQKAMTTFRLVFVSYSVVSFVPKIAIITIQKSGRCYQLQFSSVFDCPHMIRFGAYTTGWSVRERYPIHRQSGNTTYLTIILVSDTTWHYSMEWCFVTNLLISLLDSTIE